MMTDLDRSGLASASELTPAERRALNAAIKTLEPFAESENLGGLLEQVRARMPHDDDVSDALVEARAQVKAERAAVAKDASIDPLERVRLDQRLEKAEREVGDEIAARLDTTGSIARAAELRKSEDARRRMNFAHAA
jgi:hypothetical protein